MSHTLSVTVDADSSQIEVRELDTATTPRGSIETHLTMWEESSLTLLVEREYGDVALEVTVHAERPEALDASWLDVVEFSIVAGEYFQVNGWGGEDGFELPVPARVPYRVRYAIGDADSGDWNDPATTQRYSLEFWPEELSPPTEVAVLSEWGKREAQSLPRPDLSGSMRVSSGPFDVDELAEAKKWAALIRARTGS